MTEKLPISIHVCDELLSQFRKIKSVSNKLEAQFNFQTMAANWYSDEKNIWFIKIQIETDQSLLCQKKHQAEQLITQYSDDVFSYQDKSTTKQLIVCCVAVTETELTLLNQQEKLLSGLLSLKLKKVLNLIAKPMKLTPI